MEPITLYLIQNELPREERESKRIRRISKRYLIIVYHIYKMGRASPMLRYILEEDSVFVIKDVHERVCDSHIGGRALSKKILLAEYYWPSML